MPAYGHRRAGQRGMRYLSREGHAAAPVVFYGVQFNMLGLKVSRLQRKRGLPCGAIICWLF